jgi:hypothetical protein
VERGLTELPSPQVVTEIELTNEEEEDVKQCRFKGLLPVHVTGRLESRKSNVIYIGGWEIILPDAEFRLFLRLVACHP